MGTKHVQEIVTSVRVGEVADKQEGVGMAVGCGQFVSLVLGCVEKGYANPGLLGVGEEQPNWRVEKLDLLYQETIGNVAHQSCL